YLIGANRHDMRSYQPNLYRRSQGHETHGSRPLAGRRVLPALRLVERSQNGGQNSSWHVPLQRLPGEVHGSHRLYLREKSYPAAQMAYGYLFDGREQEGHECIATLPHAWIVL